MLLLVARHVIREPWNSCYYYKWHTGVQPENPFPDACYSADSISGNRKKMRGRACKPPIPVTRRRCVNRMHSGKCCAQTSRPTVARGGCQFPLGPRTYMAPTVAVRYLNRTAFEAKVYAIQVIRQRLKLHLPPAVTCPMLEQRAMAQTSSVKP